VNCNRGLGGRGRGLPTAIAADRSVSMPSVRRYLRPNCGLLANASNATRRSAPSRGFCRVNFSRLAIENHMAECTIDRFGGSGFPREAAEDRAADRPAGPPPS
jgi:hypothetical protein